MFKIKLLFGTISTAKVQLIFFIESALCKLFVNKPLIWQLNKVNVNVFYLLQFAYTRIVSVFYKLHKGRNAHIRAHTQELTYD